MRRCRVVGVAVNATAGVVHPQLLVTVKACCHQTALLRRDTSSRITRRNIHWAETSFDPLDVYSGKGMQVE
jgi:hypothetical protein